MALSQEALAAGCGHKRPSAVRLDFIWRSAASAAAAFSGLTVSPSSSSSMSRRAASISSIIGSASGRKCSRQTRRSLRIVPALDEALGLQPVDQPGNGDGFDFDNGRQLVLGEAGAALQLVEDHPLRAGHVVQAGALVEADAHEVRQLVDHRSECRRERL